MNNRAWRTELIAWAILLLIFSAIGLAIGLVANQHERQRVERGI